MSPCTARSPMVRAALAALLAITLFATSGIASLYLPSGSGIAYATSPQDELLTAGEKNQVIQFNPVAALQKRIFANGFVPNSPEFGMQLANVSYMAQRAENLGSGRVRVYYAVTG